jgi:hypothetical protein
LYVIHPIQAILKKYKTNTHVLAVEISWVNLQLRKFDFLQKNKIMKMIQIFRTYMQSLRAHDFADSHLINMALNLLNQTNLLQLCGHTNSNLRPQQPTSLLGFRAFYLDKYRTLNNWIKITLWVQHENTSFEINIFWNVNRSNVMLCNRLIWCCTGLWS